MSYENNIGGLDCSHFQKRGKETTRFDPENADAACKKCHYFIENDPDSQKTLGKFKKQQPGEKKYKLLLIRANQTGRKDDKLALIYIKQLIKAYETNIPNSK